MAWDSEQTYTIEFSLKATNESNGSETTLVSDKSTGAGLLTLNGYNELGLLLLRIISDWGASRLKTEHKERAEALRQGLWEIADALRQRKIPDLTGPTGK